MTTPTAPSTPAQSTAPAEATPAPAPTEAVQPQATPAPRPQVDNKALNAAVRRTVALKQKEQAIAKQAEELKPLQELQALAKTNPAAAFRKLAGDDRLLEAYKAVTADVVGIQDETKALEALPKSVRERLDKVAALEERASKVDTLEARLAELEKQRQEATQTLTARARADVAARTFAAGYETVAAAAADLPLLSRNPNGEALVQEEWVKVLEEKKAALPRDAAARAEFAAGLVREAAQRVQARLTEELAWVLQSAPEGVKVDPKRAAPTGKASPAPQPSASSTTGQARPPRTGTPGSLGEPTGQDPRKLTPQQRIKLLRDEEHAGRLYPR